MIHLQWRLKTVSEDPKHLNIPDKLNELKDSLPNRQSDFKQTCKRTFITLDSKKNKYVPNIKRGN